MGITPEFKMAKVALLYLMINHNFKPKVDPKEVNLNGSFIDVRGNSPGKKLNSSMHMDESSAMEKSNLTQSKYELKKKIYEEFKSQKKTKVSLLKMNDKKKEEYLKEQEANIAKLREHKLNLRDHLDLLEDKLDDTLAKMKEKEKKDNKKSPEELELTEKIEVQFRKIVKLQKESVELKKRFNGENGFDKLKALENSCGALKKNIAKLEKEVSGMAKLNEEAELNIKKIVEENKQEVAFAYFRTTS